MAKKTKIVTNGYVQVYIGDDISKADITDYKYEHIVTAEKMLGRQLKEGEEVHHLDLNRSNNSPDNLLVLNGPMHSKLHTWLDKNVIIPKPGYAERKELGCIRCVSCDNPIEYGKKYCSKECSNKERSKVFSDTGCAVCNNPIEIGRKYCSQECSSTGPQFEHKYVHPDKETLKKLLWSKPTTKVAEELGVSDKAIEKIAKKLDIQKPPRGYWTKVNSDLICPL